MVGMSILRISLILLLLALVSCKVYLPKRPVSEPTGLANTVKIYTICKNGSGFGTGVLISPRVVLTALHVVNCKGPGIITAGHGDSTVRLHLGTASPGMDLALMILEEELPYIPVELGPRPDRGEAVCSYPARKERQAVCGRIKNIGPFALNDLEMELPVIAGDSGSGLYDMGGRLVGVIIARLANDNGSPAIIGYATSLENKLKRVD